MNRWTIVNIALLLICVAFIFNGGIFGYGLFLVICAYVAFRLVCSIIRAYTKHKYNKGISKREYMLKMTARLMGVFFISGTMLYTYAFPISGIGSHAEFNNTELILRSMICSLDMFMLDVDSNIFDNLGDYPFIKGALMVQSALSFLCTALLLGSLIFSRIKSYYILHYKTKVSQEKNHLYLFFDLCDHSRMLARDINSKDPKALIVFVDVANMQEDESNSWDNIISLFTHRQHAFEVAEHSGALVSIASSRLSDIDGNKLPQDEDADIFAMIGIDKVRDLIEDLALYPTDSILRIFFLSEDEDTNIRSLINLAKDTTLLSYVRQAVLRREENIQKNGDVKEESDVKEREQAAPENVVESHRIYCHARYNGPNKVIEDLAVRKGLEVEIIDSSHLAVELMKSKPECQPVRVARLSKKEPTTVINPLKCLIVGFGEVGRDSFRFLYEYGTFVTYREGRPEAARPWITAIDSNMTQLEGLFVANTPGIDYNNGKIALRNLDYHELAFYEECLSERNCRELNYIVIALGDDDQNITLATNIFDRIRRYREKMTELIIMVRCKNDDKLEFMQKIADHYNKGCGEPDIEVIRLFGSPKEIYSYSTIIREDLTNKGKVFWENYRHQKGEGKDWTDRHDTLTGKRLLRKGKPVYPQLDNLRKLRRQENQDLSNALHASTKLWLLEKAFDKGYNWQDFLNRLFDEAGKSTITGSMANLRYLGLDKYENEVMLNLAMLEHLRWNAAHELLGYTINRETSECNERRRIHNCLRDWNELDEESIKSSKSWKCDYKSYDFCVVDTSIAVSRDELGKTGSAPAQSE